MLVDRQALRRRVKDMEADLARLTAERSTVERAMFDPGSAEPGLARLTMTDVIWSRSRAWVSTCRASGQSARTSASRYVPG